MRIELTTFSLATRCSTAELRPPIFLRSANTAEGRDFSYYALTVKDIHKKPGNS